MSGAVFCKAAPLLAFHPLNLYRTYVRRRDLKDEIYLRFSASAHPDDFVIRLSCKAECLAALLNKKIIFKRSVKTFYKVNCQNNLQ